MKQLLSTSLALGIAFCLLVATDRRAWGYVDPGTDFLALQTGASLMAACGYFFRKRVLGLFGSRPEKAPIAIAPVVQKSESRNVA